MTAGGVAGLVIELTLPATGETVGRDRSRDRASTGRAEAAVTARGQEEGAGLTGETVLAVPTLGTSRPAPLALPAGGVQPVARAALLHTLSGLTQNPSNTADCRMQ